MFVFEKTTKPQKQKESSKIVYPQTTREQPPAIANQPIEPDKEADRTQVKQCPYCNQELTVKTSAKRRCKKCKEEFFVEWNPATKLFAVFKTLAGSDYAQLVREKEEFNRQKDLYYEELYNERVLLNNELEIPFMTAEEFSQYKETHKDENTKSFDICWGFLNQYVLVQMLSVSPKDYEYYRNLELVYHIMARLKDANEMKCEKEEKLSEKYAEMSYKKIT